MSVERYIVNTLPDYVPLFLILERYRAAFLERNAC